MTAYILLLPSLLCIVAISQSNPLTSDCPVGCTRILDPICATDGFDDFRYFHNECLMRYDACHSGRAWSVALMSLCMEQMDPIIREGCLVTCPYNYDPICATNGQHFQSFGNDCILGVENCLSNSVWTAARASECGL